MRLLHAQSLTFKEFLDLRPVWGKYAIVSHRWTEEEVDFATFLRDVHMYVAGSEARRLITGSQIPYGWHKILQARKIAMVHDTEWIWIDTCCIDKSSSAELTEAINSMYKWYHDALCCYVFLPDVPSLRNDDHMSTDQTRLDRYYDPHEFDERSFRQSEWFTRGWTLQELLAPRESRFYNTNFEFIGDHSSLIDHLQSASGIDCEYLSKHQLGFGKRRIDYASIAERMGWASTRKTTREEDIAYSLLGVFDVNMPLLYGEGDKAFIRLQLEIMRKSDDESIFAWNCTKAWQLHPRNVGLLARSPGFFRAPSTSDGSSSVFQKFGLCYRPPYAMTNKGLEFTFDIPEDALHVKGEATQVRPYQTRLLMPLNCTKRTTDKHGKTWRCRVALQLDCTPMVDDQALKAKRGPDLIYGFEYEQELLQQEQGPSLVDFDYSSNETDTPAVVLSKPDRGRQMKTWKVYFPQGHLYG